MSKSVSLRWRLQLWLAFLLICVLAGFGVTVYQLQRVNRFDQIDRELEARVSALTGAVRQLYIPPPAPPKERRQMPDRERRGPPPPSGGPGSDRGDNFGPPGPPPGGPPPDAFGRGEGGFDHGPPRDNGRRGPPPNERREKGPPPNRSQESQKPKDVTLTAETAALFSSGYFYVIWYRDGSVLKRSPDAPRDLPRPESSERDTLPHLRTRQGFREAVHCSGLGDCVLAGLSVEADVQATRAFAWKLLGAGAALLAAALGLGFWFTTRAIRPIEKISAAASRISHGNLSERVEGADRDDELGSLAAVLNSTFSRLETAFSRQREFTADAAHELRTPLAVIISETQTALARERTAPEYRETVEACLETAQQMRRLTESLLELARFDAATEDRPRRELDIAETTRHVVERIRPLAEKRGIEIETSLTPARIYVNPDRLTQVISNLLTNAIAYNKPNGKIRVIARAHANNAVLEVADTGIGIAAADLPHIFDRFYRVDKARSRAEGHTGLGLAISKAIVEAEGGTIEVTSVAGAGSTFSVRLPVTRPA